MRPQEMQLTETPSVEDDNVSYQNNKQDSYFSSQTGDIHGFDLISLEQKQIIN